MRLGYAFKNITLSIDPGAPLSYAECLSQPADVIQNHCLSNIWKLEKLIQWNKRTGIQLFAIPVTLFPYAWDPYVGYSIHFASTQLCKLGCFIKESNMRIVFVLPTEINTLFGINIDRHQRVVLYRYLQYLHSVLKLMHVHPENSTILLVPGSLHCTRDKTHYLQSNLEDLPHEYIKYISLVNDPLYLPTYDLLETCEKLNVPLTLDVCSYILENQLFTRSLEKRLGVLWNKVFGQVLPLALYYTPRKSHFRNVSDLSCKQFCVSFIPEEYHLRSFDLMILSSACEKSVQILMYQIDRTDVEKYRSFENDADRCTSCTVLKDLP